MGGRPPPSDEESDPMSEPLVIIGNGMAAARLVDEIAKRALGRYAVAVVGEEPRLAYNRVLLSSLLADEVAVGDLELKPARWWRDRARGRAVAQRDGVCRYVGRRNAASLCKGRIRDRLAP